MFWDGHRWLPGDEPPKQPSPRAEGRARAWLSTFVMVGILALVAVPFGGAFAAAPSAKPVIADWKSTSQVVTYQESSRSISWKGTWYTAYNDSYLGTKVRSSDADGARVGLSFSGTAVAWVGPVGPTRGCARVYIDGNLIYTTTSHVPLDYAQGGQNEAFGAGMQPYGTQNHDGSNILHVYDMSYYSPIA